MPMSDESATQKGGGDGDQLMKSSLIDDEDEGRMQGVIGQEDAMVDQDEAVD